MGRSGGGGGGRSFGGSHSSHSSSRSHSSHSSSRSSFGSSSRSSFGGSGRSSGGLFGGPRPSPPRNRTVFIPTSSGRRYNNTVYTGSPIVNGMTSTPPRKKRRSLIPTLIIIVVAIIILYLAFAAVSQSYAGNAIQSTINRERLSGVSFTADCVDDQLGWIREDGSNAKRVGQSLQVFWDQTGIQPYVVMLPYSAQWENSDARYSWADDYYADHFNNEATMLLVYFDGRDAYTDGWWEMVKGIQVDSVMDAEATDIFWNYLDRHWYSSESVPTAITGMFRDTANVIMDKSTTPLDVAKVAVTGTVVVVILVCVLVIMKVKRRNDAAKAAETERILNTPLEQIDADDDPLVNKYKTEKETE